MSDSGNEERKGNGVSPENPEEYPRDGGREWGCDTGGDAWWEDRSLPAKIFMGIGFGILGAGFVVLMIFAVMWLWNWLMPDIFGLKSINFWKSAGLLCLSFILFKSWGSGCNNARNDRKRKRHLRRYMEEDRTGEERIVEPEKAGEGPAGSPAT